MSTCGGCTQPSKGFGLDWDAPFSFTGDNVFTLLDCSTTTSPIFRSNSYNVDNSSAVPLCDKQGAPVVVTCTLAGQLAISRFPHAAFTRRSISARRSNSTCRSCSALRIPLSTASVAKNQTLITGTAESEDTPEATIHSIATALMANFADVSSGMDSGHGTAIGHHSGRAKFQVPE
ncbi:hypothetical protein F3Y22_tig00111059pilonHSYRG00006 [Hibiscus syriacus]|uniref:Uncharacterized protein n=1 Tax=Hibiscus syriacus TaxID=106335 RepID=A0A6A2Z5U4_HIBSY|nr:hypothetical protein F3Y22_tig00111059pilonHSYRG00006 [Hibiscus syriacus]